jgi:restriction system protein
MAIPKYHEIMLPLLRFFEDKKVHSKYDFFDQISAYFSLTDTEKNETIATGGNRLLNRIGWAITFMNKAKLLTRPERSKYQITQRGLDLLKTNPEFLTPQLIINLYPDVMDDPFYNSGLRVKRDENNQDTINIEIAPEEALDNILEQNKSAIYSDLLEQIKNLSPRNFEILVVKVLLAMGYGDEEHSFTTQYTNDGGIDGIIQADELGFEKIYIQAKKYESKVGRPELQKFIGAMTGTNKGVFITTSDFTENVKDYLNSRQEKVVLINGLFLAKLMYKHNQGVSISRVVEIKSLDTDYFENL